MSIIRRIRGSLVYKITVSLTFIVAILLAVLILSNVYSLKVVTGNMISASQSEMAIHINDIENEIGSSTKDLNEIYVKYLDNIVGYRNKNDFDKYTSATQLRDVLSAKVLNGKTEDGLFILKPEDSLYLMQFSSRISTNDRMNLDHFFRTKELFQNSVSGGWNIRKIGGSHYFLRSFKSYDILAGVLIKADSLLNYINRISSNQGRYVLTDESGKILVLSKNSSILAGVSSIPNQNEIVENFRGKYFMITKNVPGLSLRLSIVIENRNVFYGLELIQWVIIALGIVSFIIIPVVILYLFREIIKPVHELVIATKEVEKGNWDYRIPQKKAPMEFAKLNASFASMVKEIKTLKISSYEEKIERQKAELKYLQMQIKPHFFLNVITTISSLTYQNKNEEIRRLIDFLSRHLRYMFKGGLVKVPITEEMEHVRNYIGMQELRFPDNVFYLMDIAPEVEQCLIPQFLIHTFVENIFKHALSVGDMLSVFIKAEECRIRDELFVRITVEDNGDGFPDEVIEALNSPDGNESGNGRKIGIMNIKRTLGLLYKRDDLLKAGNCEPSGARVEILVPAERREK